MKQSATLRLTMLVSMYLDIHKNKRLRSSTADLTSLAFRWLIDFAGDMPATELAAEDVEIFQSYLVDAGLSKTTANIYTRAISPVFTWAVFRSLAKSNPFKSLRKYKVTPRGVTVYTSDEIDRLLAVSDDLWKARIHLGLTSLRKGEVLNLTVNDIDFDKQLIKIQPKKESPFWWDWEPKDYERRVLPLVPTVNVLLIKLLEKLPAGQPYLLLRKERYSYLLSIKGRMTDRMRNLPETNFDRTFRKMRQRAMVQGTFHQLRKTALTELTGGMRLQEVQELAGHSSIETTRCYLASRPDFLRRAHDILDKQFAQSA